MARKYIFSALTVSCSRVTRPCWPSQSIWKVPAHHTCHWEVVGLRWPCFGVAGCDAVHGEPQGCVRSPPYNPVMCWGKAGAHHPPPARCVCFSLLSGGSTATLCCKSMSPFERFPKRSAAFPTCSDSASPHMTAFWNAHKYVFSPPIHVLKAHLSNETLARVSLNEQLSDV